MSIIFEPRSRYEDIRESVETALSGRQASMWTALPGIIKKFDEKKLIVNVQPSVQGLLYSPDGSGEFKDLPELPDVPIVFPRGGGYELTFPIKEGDECLIVFSSRCFDFWWDQGGVQRQRELRMHDLSDGFAIAGPWSQKTKIDNVNTKTTQLRTDDGKVYVEVDHDNNKITVMVQTAKSDNSSGSTSAASSSDSTTTQVIVDNKNRIITASSQQTIVTIDDKNKRIRAAIGDSTSAALDDNAKSIIATTGSTSVTLDDKGRTISMISGGTSITLEDDQHAVSVLGELRVSGNVTAGYAGAGSVTLLGHRHTQGLDSHLDAEQPTNPPTPGT